MLLFKLEFLKIVEWNCMIDVNICGVLYGIGVVLFIMKEQNSGYIVNIVFIGVYEVIFIVVVYCVIKYVVCVIIEGL